MSILSRLVDWANRPSLDEQLAREMRFLQMELETARTHMIGLRARNEQLRAMMGEPPAGTIEITIRATNQDGAPVSTRYRMRASTDTHADATLLGTRATALLLVITKSCA